MGRAEGVFLMEGGHVVHNGPGRLPLHHGFGLPADHAMGPAVHLDIQQLRLHRVLHQGGRNPQPGRRHQQGGNRQHQSRFPPGPPDVPDACSDCLAQLHEASSPLGTSSVMARFSPPAGPASAGRSPPPSAAAGPARSLPPRGQSTGPPWRRRPSRRREFPAG